MRHVVLMLMAILLPGCSRGPVGDFLFGIALEGDPTAAELKAFASQTGLKPQLVVAFDSWSDSAETFESPEHMIREATLTGAVPVLTWEPWVFVKGEAEPRVVDAGEILAGKWDAAIVRYLRAVAATQTEVWIRFAHEMNTSRYHWGIPNAKDFGPSAPFTYRRIFRYVVARARNLGASNIRWVFCPNAGSVPPPTKQEDWNAAARYYPGDDFVDILGMDGYNWGTTIRLPEWQSRWISFHDLFSPLREELQRLAPGKLLVVCETASATEGGNKAVWISEAAATVRAWHLRGLVWFEVKKETDWRILAGINRSDLEPFREPPPVQER
jgi:hypothetical protein